MTIPSLMKKAQEAMKSHGIWLLLLLLLGYPLFCYQLGQRDLWAPDEDEYALVSREMVQQGHWLLPTVNLKPYTIKPVFLNWLIALFSLPEGKVSEFTARLPSCLSALGCVMVVFFLGTRLFPRRGGLLSALILATTPLFVFQARWVQIYMLFTFLSTSALALFYYGYEEATKRRPCYLLMYAMMGLATLTMGPVGLLLPLLVIFLFLFLKKDLLHFFHLEWRWGMGLYLFLVIPWYAYVSLFGGKEYAYDLLVRTNVSRYFDTWIHKRPFYYYVIGLPGYFFPWIFFLPCAIASLLKRMSKEALFILCWFSGMFVFFSLSQCKRGDYLLPLYPSMALMVGYLWNKALPGRDSPSPIFPQSIALPLWLLLPVVGLSFLGLIIFTKIKHSLFFILVLKTSLIVFIFLLMVFLALRLKRPLLAFSSMVFLMVAITLFSMHSLVPRLEEHKSPRFMGEKIKALTSPDQRWFSYGFLRCCYIFYSERNAKKIEKIEDDHNGSLTELNEALASQQRTVVLMREKDYSRLLPSLKVKTYLVYKDQVGHRTLVLISNQPLIND